MNQIPIMVQKPTVDVRDPSVFLRMDCNNNDGLIVHNDGKVHYIVMEAKLTPADKGAVNQVNELLKTLNVNLEVVYK